MAQLLQTLVPDCFMFSFSSVKGTAHARCQAFPASSDFLRGLSLEWCLQVLLLLLYYPTCEEAGNLQAANVRALTTSLSPCKPTESNLGCVQVVLLPVYHPTDEEASDPQLYAANVRALMARELGASLSDHGIEHNGALKKNHVHVNMTGTKVIMAS